MGVSSGLAREYVQLVNYFENIRRDLKQPCEEYSKLSAPKREMANINDLVRAIVIFTGN